MTEKALKGRRRHVPTRTCVACRQSDSKRQLIRIVRDPDGSVQVDLSGKRAGRGAYLCRQRSCWDQALRRGSLASALKTKIDEGSMALLKAFAETLPAGADGTAGDDVADAEA